METEPTMLSRTSPDDAVQEARELMAAFLIALRIHSLYPEDHVMCEKALANVWAELDRFVRSQGPLRLKVEKGKLLMDGIPVHEAAPEDGNLPFVLFRDGVMSLEFQEGIEPWEVGEFVKVMNRYSSPSQDAEGDVVTALWEHQFPHVEYEAAEVLWEAGEEGGGVPWERPFEGSPGREEDPPPPSQRLPADVLESGAWELTPKEEEQLRQMVLSEEQRDPIGDVTDMLVDLLLEQEGGDDFPAVLEFLEEEFRNGLGRRDFPFAFRLLQRVRQLRVECHQRKPWAVSLVEQFFLTVSGGSTLRVMQSVWEQADGAQLEQIRQILLVLPAEAFEPLASMLVQAASPAVQRMLLDVLCAHARQDMGSLEALLSRPDDELMRRLVQVLGRLDGEGPTRLLLEKVRHSSEAVRKEAVKALLVRGPWVLRELFPLIEDPSPMVRRLVLEYLGWRRSDAAEGLLLEYLEGKGSRMGKEHLVACFRALGRCGSARSVPFLRRSLRRRGWIPGMRKAAYRQGAAVALKALEIPGAQQVLEEAALSSDPWVRVALRKAARMEGGS